MGGLYVMNNRDIAKVGFAVLAAVMSYNFADTVVHAEETSVEPVKETAPVENQDELTDVIDALLKIQIFLKKLKKQKFLKTLKKQMFQKKMKRLQQLVVVEKLVLN